MNKELIKKRFGRKLKEYNENARIQRRMAEKLISMLSQTQKESPSDILEIGCGTGLLTEYSVNNLSYKTYTAIDIVPECEEYIKSINNEIDFVSGDIEEYIVSDNKKYDLIISNAALQWIDNLTGFVDKLTDKLKDGGILLFSSFGTENFREIFFVTGKTLSYFSKKEYEEKLEKYKPLIEEEAWVMAFKTPQEVLKHIQSTGVNALSSEAWTKRDLMNFEKEYNGFCANRPTLTYNPLYIKIQK